MKNNVQYELNPEPVARVSEKSSNINKRLFTETPHVQFVVVVPLSTITAVCMQIENYPIIPRFLDVSWRFVDVLRCMYTSSNRPFDAPIPVLASEASFRETHAMLCYRLIHGIMLENSVKPCAEKPNPFSANVVCRMRRANGSPVQG